MEYNTLLAFMAVLPAAVLLIIVYRMDKVEKEPIGLLAKVFFFGLLTTISASLLEMLGGFALAPFFGNEGNIVYSFLFYFLVVAGAEEGGKYFVLKKSTWNNPNLNYSYDGIIYSVCASLGFATLENILYVFQYGFGVAVMRALLSVPGHCIFGVFMGVYYGLAKGNEIRGNIKGRDINLKKAFWIPVALHGTYDFCLTSGQDLEILFLVFIALEIFMVVRAIKLVKLMSATDAPFIPMQAGAAYGQPMQGMQPQFGQAQPQFAQGMQPQFGQVQPQFAQGMQPQFGQAQPQFAQGMQPQFGQAQPQFTQAQPQFAQGQPQFAQGQPQYAPGMQPQFAQDAQPQFGQAQPQFAQDAQPQFGQAQPQFAQDAQPQYAPGMQPQFTQDAQPQFAQAQPVQDAATQAQPVQVQTSSAITEPLAGVGAGVGEAVPEILIQNEPLEDGLTNPNPVFSSEDF